MYIETQYTETHNISTKYLNQTSDLKTVIIIYLQVLKVYRKDYY